MIRNSTKFHPTTLQGNLDSWDDYDLRRVKNTYTNPNSILKWNMKQIKPNTDKGYEQLKMARKAIDLGFYISFSGIVTFKNAETLRETVKKIPIENILIETDSPYLAPVPNRGKLNEPANVRYVAEKIAELKGIPIEKVAEITTNNFFTLFSKCKTL